MCYCHNTTMACESKVCIFCCKTFTGIKEQSLCEKRNELLAQFFIILQRKFKSRQLSEHASMIFQILSEHRDITVLTSCVDCSKVLESFCAFYEEMKILELKLPWKLQTLSVLMKMGELLQGSKLQMKSVKISMWKEGQGISLFYLVTFGRNFSGSVTQEG